MKKARKFIKKRRKLEGKTDYKARIALLKSNKPRVVFRKSNRYVIGQFIKSKEARDTIIVGVNSKQLMGYGWSKDAVGSLKSIPACYLTGFLLGKKVLDKDKETDTIFDTGLLRSLKKSKIYAFLKGVKDSGLNVKSGKDIFPDEKKLQGEFMKNKVDVSQIKLNIEKKFV